MHLRGRPTGDEQSSTNGLADGAEPCSIRLVWKSFQGSVWLDRVDGAKRGLGGRSSRQMTLNQRQPTPSQPA